MPGRIAPHAMAWRRRMGSLAGPLSASGEASNGEPVQVEIYLNGAWTDITSYVMVRDNSGNISITRGRRDEGSTTEQSTCQLMLNNRDGRWSPRNPSGAYFGLIGRNTPIRVSVPNGLGGKSYRFRGEISSWPQMWDPTGTDVWTEVEASGLLRRLSQGPPAERSSLYSAITAISTDTLKAYWPCEDAQGATNIASGLANGPVMTFTGTPTLADYEDFPMSDPVPTLTDSSLTGVVPSYSMTGVTQYQVRFLLAIPSDGLNDLNSIARLKFSDDDAMVYLDVHYNNPPGGVGSYGSTGTLTLLPRDGDQAEIAASGDQSITLDTRGRKLLVSIEAQNNGSNLSATLRVMDVSSGVTDSATMGVASINVARVYEIQMAPETLTAAIGAGETAFGHVMLQTQITSIDALGRSVQPVGEPAGRRVERVCAENAIAFESIGDLDDSVAMGRQTKQKPLDLMQEAELADTGMLYETTSVLGLGYRTRVALSNQDPALTLDYSGYHLSEIPQPIEDDRYIQNKVTVTVDGVSASYALESGALSIEEPPAGVGIYGTDVTLNLQYTSEAESQAAWRVHLGTVDEPRYPRISVNLAHSSFTANPALKQAVLGIRQGDRIKVQNLPFWLPPGDIDQLVLGFEESITHFEHRVTFICAPASPYTLGVVDGTDVRIDTDGSELLAAVSTSDTELDVAPSSGKKTLWTTDSAYFPFDVKANAEVMTVTSISSYAYDTYTRTESGAWGTADSGQTWGVIGGTVGTDYAVGSGYGSHTLTTVDSSRRAGIDFTYPNVDVTVRLTTSATATGGSIYGGPLVRYVDANNLYMLRIEFTTANAINLDVRKRVASTESSLATYATSLTHVAGTFINSRFQVIGSTLRAKVWAVGAEEPTWQITVSDTSITTSNFVGCRSISAASNTNVNPSVRYDEFEVLSPQTFTVTRATNDVQQSHAAGTSISLADPTIISL